METVRKLAALCAEKSAALDLALARLAPMEPGDSRAVSSEFVAMAAVASGAADDACMAVIHAALTEAEEREAAENWTCTMKTESVEWLEGENERLHEALKRLRSAAENVCAYDWSDNDPDAVAAIDALRAELSSGQ